MSVFPNNLLLACILGLISGSFVSAFTYRFPRAIDWVRGRSFCPKCRKKISWYDNLPLLSFILLWGRCRKCGQKISLRYPVIEIITVLGFVLIGLNFYLLIIFLLTLSILVIDLEQGIIPDNLVFWGIAITLIYFLSVNSPNLFVNFLSGLLASSFLLLIHLLTRGRGMGLGDVKLALFIGFVLGWPRTLFWLFSSFILGAVVGLTLVLFRRLGLKDKIAFGPFLVVAFWIILLLLI